MQRDQTLLCEEAEAAGDVRGAEASASVEQSDFVLRWREEGLWQDREERKTYATRIFRLVCLWLSVIVALVFLQGFLGQRGWFGLSDSVLITIATTTTASATAILVAVVRYLSHTSSPACRTAPPPRNMDR